MILPSSTPKIANLTHKLGFSIIVVILIIVAGSTFEYKKRFMGASSSHNMSPPVKVQPKEKATASLIFLHGLGDTGHGWAEQFRDFSFKHIRCVCPHAPQKPVSLNGGMIMPSWFDIRGLDPGSAEDEQGIKDSSRELQQLIAKEISDGIPAERIIIGGFSQGGAVALYTAFGTDTKVGGVLALSTWLPMNKYFTNPTNTKYNTNIPVLQCHGTSDPLVSFRWGHATNEIIKTFNPTAQFKSYSNLGHSSCASEMEDVKQFLQDVLKDS
ncbi:acyl-protein thioesterase 1-like isoform X1 [Biomphalaria glabrata]|uniref:palmitoyl-protein hydrolase n=2 Tax=Biomphalaria glabrata TaxID=6526 RepID=A0A2C9JHA0_BIOGL|nr:acyl-protein thioesterase 1-like isoform X1 [Biomphalaria glabrata]